MMIYRLSRCGILLLSGDIDHKPSVSCEPEVKVVDLDDECDFLVLGCDGLFDQLSPHDVVSHAYHAALNLNFDTTLIADQLTQAAVSKGNSSFVSWTKPSVLVHPECRSKNEPFFITSIG